MGSLEFCTGALKTQLIFVLGHTNCGAIKGATAAYLASKDAKRKKAAPSVVVPKQDHESITNHEHS